MSANWQADPRLLQLSAALAVAYSMKDREHCLAFVEAFQSAIDEGLIAVVSCAEPAFQGKAITTTRPGQCRVCQTRLISGSRVIWVRGEGIACIGCAPEGP